MQYFRKAFENEGNVIAADASKLAPAIYDADKYYIVDGLSRFLSLSLLLHAVCECYKKTTPKNENAIKTIRLKYLTKPKGYKLHLNDSEHQ